MAITLGGGVSINSVYYTIFSNVLCLSFCQIPSSYQNSHMQIICEFVEVTRHHVDLAAVMGVLRH